MIKVTDLQESNRGRPEELLGSDSPRIVSCKDPGSASLHGLHGTGRECLAAERRRQRESTGHAREQHAAFATGFPPQGKMSGVGRTIAFGQRLVDALATNDTTF